MSGCRSFEEAISLHAAGGLEEAAREAVDAHLPTCPACAGELAETRALLAELAADRPALAPDRAAAFASRVRAAAARGAGRAANRGPWRWRAGADRPAVRLLAGAGALAAAAALVLALRLPGAAGPGIPGAPPPRAEPLAPLDGAAALALADALAAAGDEALDLLPEADGLEGLTDEELLAMDSLLASQGG